MVRYDIPDPLITMNSGTYYFKSDLVVRCSFPIYSFVFSIKRFEPDFQRTVLYGGPERIINLAHMYFGSASPIAYRNRQSSLFIHKAICDTVDLSIIIGLGI